MYVGIGIWGLLLFKSPEIVKIIMDARVEIARERTEQKRLDLKIAQSNRL